MTYQNRDECYMDEWRRIQRRWVQALLQVYMRTKYHSLVLRPIPKVEDWGSRQRDGKCLKAPLYLKKKT